MNFFELNQKESFRLFSERLQSSEDFDQIIIDSKACIAHLSGKNSPDLFEAIQRRIALEARWYKSLDEGTPDYSVYSDPTYIAETWACWIIYSRKYLRMIQKPESLLPYGIVSDLGNVSCIVDLGCGLGYTTGFLKYIFPSAEVYGTNLEDTLQIKICRANAKEFGFKIVTELEKIKPKTDLVFASEYFEHIYEPVAHLREIISTLNPRNFLIASTFGPRSIGHFDYYKVDGEIVNAHTTSLLFNKELKKYGYEKIKTKLWNNRPAYWKKKSTCPPRPTK